MTHLLIITTLLLYALAMLFIFLYSLSQAHLLWSYIKKRKTTDSPPFTAGQLPTVTIQLPVFNEKYVVQRLIDAVCGIQYPPHLLEIQLLDDSTDESLAIAQTRISFWQQQGIDIKQIKRPANTGFKAGALQHGLALAKGQLIAVFDADFVPDPQFLHHTIPHFANPEVGLVQTRWSHLNRNHSLLTKVQAFALDAHFSVEQTGRNKMGAFINFNGTAGVWRKQAIIDAGNWQADTLTEDLDLSYRAQINGWQFVYLENVCSPAELPMAISAVKGQQYRWNKGGAEVARKMLPKVWASNIAFYKKVHASFHLLNSGVFIAIFLSACLSVPLVYIKAHYPQFKTWITLGSFTLLSFMVISAIYFVANKKRLGSGLAAWGSYLLYFPVFLSMSMGLSLHNAIAVIEGYVGKKSPFIRTPKFNIATGSGQWKNNSYLKKNYGFLFFVEMLLLLFFMAAVAADCSLGDLALLPFHTMLVFGFGCVVFYTLFQNGTIKKQG